MFAAICYPFSSIFGLMEVRKNICMPVEAAAAMTNELAQLLTVLIAALILLGVIAVTLTPFLMQGRHRRSQEGSFMRSRTLG